MVDTSAVAAVLFSGSTASQVVGLLDDADERVMASPTFVEVAMVLESRLGPEGAAAAERFLRDGEIDVVAFDRSQAARAAEGWRRFGKGRHPAALNLGDCFTYGLAATTGFPVLCVGNDFRQTDVDVVPREA